MAPKAKSAPKKAAAKPKKTITKKASKPKAAKSPAKKAAKPAKKSGSKKPAAKKSKGKKEKGDKADKPKRPPSAYMNFCKANRAGIIKANPKATFGEVGKLMGAAWGKLNDAAKAKHK